MGTHVTYKPIDENSLFFKLCLENPQIAEFAPDLPGGNLVAFSTKDKIYLKAHRECEIMYMENPLLRQVGRYFSDKTWDALHYLLSENRRYMAHGNHNDLVERAIVGGDLLTDPDVSRPVRYISSEEAAHFSVLLAGIDNNSLFQHFDEDRMEQVNVYKFGSEAGIIESFFELRDYYLKVSFYGFAVMMWFVH